MHFITKTVVWFLSLFQTVSSFFGISPTQTLRVNPYETYQTIEGFGTSSAWWAQKIGDGALADQICKLLYDDQEGLGLEIFRYNVGGGEKENPSSIIAMEDRKTESFYRYNDVSGAWEFDFSRDENARRVLDAAVRYGAKRIVLFANSPHFSMTVNGKASGNETAGVCNLPQENYAKFVDYMLTVADHFVSLGYPIYAVSPINEPQWDWGTGWVSQEGCHYSPEEAVALLRLFAETMRQRNTPYTLCGPESGQMSEGFAEYERLFCEDEVLSSYCAVYSGHSYWMDGDVAGKQAAHTRLQTAYGKPFGYEMSEWCELPQTLDPDTIESGLRMANVMMEDLTVMNAVSWQSWTAVNGDGLMELRDGAPHLFKRYYIMKQFSSFIPEGAVRIGIFDSALDQNRLKTAAFDCGDAVIFIVLNDTGEDIAVRFSGAYRSLTVARTSAAENCETVYEGRPVRSQVFPSNSLTTLRFIKHGC